jgi:hypothetical protein
MTFKVGTEYIQTFTVGIKRWTVTKRTAKTVTVTGDQWAGEVYTKRISTDAAGVETITFTKRYAGTLSAGNDR